VEIYNSVWKHVVRNWDGPDAKAFAGIYKSNWVCSVVRTGYLSRRYGSKSYLASRQWIPGWHTIVNSEYLVNKWYWMAQCNTFLAAIGSRIVLVPCQLTVLDACLVEVLDARLRSVQSSDHFAGGKYKYLTIIEDGTGYCQEDFTEYLTKDATDYLARK
jgi:hypothetical protein